MQRLYVTLFIVFLSIFTSAQNPKHITTIAGEDLSGFQCEDGACAEMLTGNSAPKYLGGFEQLADKLNQQLSIPKKVNGDLMVTFLINCKAEIGFVRLMARERWKGLNKYIDSDGEMFKSTFIHVANWSPAFKDGEEIDAMHTIVIAFKKGEIIAISNGY